MSSTRLSTTINYIQDILFHLSNLSTEINLFLHSQSIMYMKLLYGILLIVFDYSHGGLIIWATCHKISYVMILILLIYVSIFCSCLFNISFQLVLFPPSKPEKNRFRNIIKEISLYEQFYSW